MRVLLLTRYGRTGASSRLRSLQYLPHLATEGIDVTVAPLFSNKYVAALYAGTPRLGEALLGYGARLRALAKVAQYDLVWVEKELFPFLPAVVEFLWGSAGTRYVVDYDDALFHRYDCHPNPIVRLLLGRKIDKVMRHSTLVIAGNEYLGSRARAAGSARVEIIPTVVDTTKYKVARAEGGERPVIGWIGSPGTARYLSEVVEPLCAVQQECGANIRLIGSGPVNLGRLECEVLEWRESSEAELLKSIDIGIMPLPDNPWERGKCGYKLIQYMACGKPVVASPVGVNREIVEHGVNGFLANTPEEWRESLAALASNRELRDSMGAAGRRKVEERYSLQATAPVLADLLKSAKNTENARNI